MSKNRYEGLLVLNITGKEDGAQKTIDRLEKAFVAEGCEIESIQKMDNRHFSYVAGKVSNGFYVNFVFTAAPGVVASLQTKFKADPDIYRQQYGRLAAKKAAA